MSKKRQVLDHGYVQLVESWGSDERVIEAARMSTQKGFEGWGPNTCSFCQGAGTKDGAVVEYVENSDACSKCKGLGQVDGDEKLLKYLWDNKHATPFEMAGMVIEVQAPIFVFREWHRHRVQSFSEMSARYTPLPAINYIPTIERLMMNSGHSTKQAGAVSGSTTLTEEAARLFIGRLGDEYLNQEILYQTSLMDGVPKELARLVLPVSRYSRMRASTSLRCWLMFLTLRMDKAAQWEIRCYANAVGELIEQLFPRTWELFVAGQKT